MTESPVVLVDAGAPVAQITINRPDKLNALNREVLTGLREAIQQITARDDVTAVVLAGAGGKAFVAGADIAEMAEMSAEQARAFARDGQALGSLIDESGKLFIAAVDGFALGGGCELAMMCHLRVAGAKARFSQPELGLGLIPGFGGTQRLPRLIGEGRALLMLLTGQMIDAATAAEWGLVDHLAQDQSAVDAARSLAEKTCEQGPLAVRYALRAVREGRQMPLDQALEYEASLFGVTFATQDMREGTAAFLAKRKPEFGGR